MYPSPLHPSSLPSSLPARRSPRRRGFTLIEILVCVVILSICAAVVVPQMSDRSDVKTASAARALVADLLYAQNRSIATCTWTYVVFDPSNKTYSLLSALPATAITHPVYYKPYVVTYGPGTQFPDVALGAVAINSDTALTTLAFDPLGTPYAINASNTPVFLAASAIPITCNAATMTVIVDPVTGQVRIQ